MQEMNGEIEMLVFIINCNKIIWNKTLKENNFHDENTEPRLWRDITRSKIKMMIITTHSKKESGRNDLNGKV